MYMRIYIFIHIYIYQHADFGFPIQGMGALWILRVRLSSSICSSSASLSALYASHYAVVTDFGFPGLIYVYIYVYI